MRLLEDVASVWGKGAGRDMLFTEAYLPWTLPSATEEVPPLQERERCRLLSVRLLPSMPPSPFHRQRLPGDPRIASTTFFLRRRRKFLSHRVCRKENFSPLIIEKKDVEGHLLGLLEVSPTA